jgi:hypothetical protein
VMKAQREQQNSGVHISQTAMDLANWMGDNPHAAMAMLFCGWLLEASVFLILLNRRISLVFGLILVVFHLMNGWFMGLPFPTNRKVVWLVFVNVPFWLWFLYRTLRQQPASTSGACLIDKPPLKENQA